jgi:hypothetical protein
MLRLRVFWPLMLAPYRVIMMQIKFRSRTELVLCTTYIERYAFWSNTELVRVFQSTGTLVPFGIPAESGRNVPPSSPSGDYLPRIAPVDATVINFGVQNQVAAL